jgi:hypothetical protein
VLEDEEEEDDVPETAGARQQDCDAMNPNYPLARDLCAEIWRALSGGEVWLDRVRSHGDSALPSPFTGTDFAANVASASAAVGEVLEAAGAAPSVIDVDRMLSSSWLHVFPMSPWRLQPDWRGAS